MRRIDFEVYGLPVDAFIVSGNSCRLCLDFPFDLGKVIKSSARDMMELCPLLLSCYTCWSVWCVDFMIFWFVIALAGDIDELKN